MDYEQKYKDALERAKKLYGQGTITESLGYIFPELNESEDEKIRQSIIADIKSKMKSCTHTLDNYYREQIAWLEKQSEPSDKGEISDGFHTFNELYYYRMLYNAAFFNMLPKEWVHKSKKHNDGEECFGGGWFIVMANLPTGQISNHYELKDWDLFQIPEKERADKWDGHTPQEAAERLHNFLLKKQGEQKPQDKSALEAWKEKKVDNRNKVESAWNNGYCNGYIQAIDKACEWLENHNDYIDVKDGNVTYFDMEKCVKDFKKHMKGNGND